MVSLIAKPSKIMYILLLITQGFNRFIRWWKGHIQRIVKCNGFCFFYFLFKPLQLLFSINQIACCAYYIILGKSNTYIKASKFRIKFTLINIWHIIPSVFIVYSWFRIPLCYLIRFPYMTTS